MGKSNDAPDYPVEFMREQLAVSEAAGNRYLNLSEQQQQWAQDMWGEEMYPLLQEVYGAQSEVMNEQLSNARADRERYQSVYQPLEDDLIAEFQNYDSQERQNLEAGRAMGQVQQAFDAQRANSEQRLASYGIDPSQLRAGAIDMQARNRAALAQAQAGNAARQRVEDTGRSLRAEAINIGRGMPSQVAAAYGQTLNAGNSAMGNMNSTMGQGANMMGTGQGWGQMQGNQLGQTMSGINNMYSGQLAGYEASGSNMAALGNIAGQAFGAWAGSGFAEGGGAVGLRDSDLSSTPGPNDKIPVTLAENEYIIPADVVVRMGTEKLDKLVESTRQKSGEAGGANANTPAGEMPNPETPIKGQTLAAEGGGAVGYMPPAAIAVSQQDLANPGFGMATGDPFAAYHQAAALGPGAQPADFAGAIDSGAAMRENWDKGEGMPGAIKDWLARRQTTTAANEAKAAYPTDLSAEGGGAVGKSKASEYMLSPQEEEELRRRAQMIRDAQPEPQQQQGAAINPSMFMQGAGGGGGGGGGEALSSAGPWAALAAAIAYNEDRQRSAGNRPDSRGERLQDGLTGKSLERDMDRYGDKIGGVGGNMLKVGGKMGHPEGVFNFGKKSLKNTFTPWKLLD